MRMYKIISAFILGIIYLIPLISKAQQKSYSVDEEKQRIHQFFNNCIIKDTSAIYSFAFKVQVKKNKKGFAEVSSLSVNDPVAYALYPGYKFLETVHYNLFMKEREEAVFIFPVVIEVSSQKAPLPNSNGERFNTICKLLYMNLDEVTNPEDRVYFRPFLLRVDKTIYE